MILINENLFILKLHCNVGRLFFCITRDELLLVGSWILWTPHLQKYQTQLWLRETFFLLLLMWFRPELQDYHAGFVQGHLHLHGRGRATLWAVTLPLFITDVVAEGA